MTDLIHSLGRRARRRVTRRSRWLLAVLSVAALAGVLVPAAMASAAPRPAPITATDAAVMNKIWQGPVSTSGRRLWYGLARGASLDYLGATSTIGGVTTPEPFSIPLGWLGEWLKHNPDWNWKTMSYAQFDRLFTQSVGEFSSLVATNNPDLRAFNDHGGKILIWAGTADGLINPQGIIQYYKNVQQTMGGAAATNSFARLFLAPGAGHCANGAGPAPTDPVAAVVKWVEHGQAPQTIPATLTNSAGAAILSWPICAYPQVASYTGHGSPSQARNYTCAPRAGTGKGA